MVPAARIQSASGIEPEVKAACRPIRVCHVAAADMWAGAEAQLAVLVRSLVKMVDLRVSAVLFNEGRLACELRAMGIETVVIPEAQQSALSIARQLVDHFRRRQIDVVHTHKYKDNVIGALAAAYGGVRWRVRTVHGRPEHQRGLPAAKAKTYHQIDSVVLRCFVDRIIAVSLDLEKQLAGKFGGNRVVCVHNAIDSDQVSMGADGASRRERLAADDDAILIGTMGRLVPVKGLDVFIAAAHLIRRQRPNVKFVIAGDGPSKGALEAAVRRYGLDRDVLFLGYRNDAYDILGQMDIFVLPSLNEGVPMVLLEALALARPVVASRTGGIAEVIEDGVSGLLVAAGREDELAERCVMLMDRIDLRKALGTAGCRRVQEHFASRAMAQRVADVYRELVYSGGSA